MVSSPFLQLPPGLEITTTEMVADCVRVEVVSTKGHSRCPLCNCSSVRIHSRYRRVVADTPCAGFGIQLVLRIRKFFCETASCPRKIFTERFPAFVEPWARMTTRLSQIIQAIGLATCGEVGARLAWWLGLHTSPSTVLRRIMLVPLESVRRVVQVGIDDFAFRRGKAYGTILIDLQTHQVIDLLPDRKVETTKTWLQAHPEIKLVSRDRGGDYAAAASQGAPQAVQTADRFHLCKNLTEAVEKALARCRAEIRKSQKAKKKPAEVPLPEESLPALSTVDGKPYSAHQTERYDRYQQVVALREQGAKVKEIAQRVGLGVRTIQRWLKDGTYVETNYHHRHRSRFDTYESYVRKRWDEGCHNIQQIWREIRVQGYPHSDRALRAHLEAVRGKKPADLPEAGVLDHFSAKKAVWLFVRPWKDLSEQEQEELLAMRQTSATAETIYQLVQEFFCLVRSRQGTQLNSWLSKVEASAIPELQHFAHGLERDKAAVLAGLTLPWSNGPTEGHVNRLKLIKRMMYGRAEFPLLRQRVLHCA